MRRSRKKKNMSLPVRREIHMIVILSRIIVGVISCNFLRITLIPVQPFPVFSELPVQLHVTFAPCILLLPIKQSKRNCTDKRAPCHGEERKPNKWKLRMGDKYGIFKQESGAAHELFPHLLALFDRKVVSWYNEPLSAWDPFPDLMHLAVHGPPFRLSDWRCRRESRPWFPAATFPARYPTRRSRLSAAKPSGLGEEGGGRMGPQQGQGAGAKHHRGFVRVRRI